MEKQITLTTIWSVGFVACAVLFLWVLAKSSGWRKLAESYANDTPFEAREWRVAQAAVRRLPVLPANLTLSIGADRQFLYLRPWLLPLPGFRGLRVPWGDITVRNKRVLFWRYCYLRFRQVPGTEVHLSETAMQQLVGGAGGLLAEGRVEFPM